MTDHPLNILKWLAEAGDEIALDEKPIDRFAETQAKIASIKTKSEAKSNSTRADIAARAKAVAGKTGAAREKTSQNAKTGAGNNGATLPDENAIASAREIAKNANSIVELKIAIAGFEDCNLKRGAKNLVFADGNVDAEIMFIGKSPERDEDMQGIPFSGIAGTLFDKMLASIGLDRQKVYLAPIIPWLTPGSRPPTQAECELCKPFIERHIELAKPKILVTMGNAATRTLLNKKQPVARVRGSWEEILIGEHTTMAIPTLNPTYLLKQPAQKALIWEDLLKIKAKLAE